MIDPQTVHDYGSSRVPFGHPSSRRSISLGLQSSNRHRQKNVVVVIEDEEVPFGHPSFERSIFLRFPFSDLHGFLLNLRPPGVSFFWNCYSQISIGSFQTSVLKAFYFSGIPFLGSP